MTLFDSHCHLQDDRLLPRLEEVLSRAREAGVVDMLCCATGESDWLTVLEIAGRHPGRVIPALGIHPWYLDDRTPDALHRLTRLLADHPEAAVGEIGLDHAVSPRRDEEQEALFAAQLYLAAEEERPVSVHCRQAWGRLVELLDTAPRLPPALVIHSYSGPPEMIPRLLPFNVRFSFSGSLTRSQNRRGQAAAAAVPADRLLLETDAPDIDPQPDPDPDGRRPVGPPNEPANARTVAHRLAALRGMTVDEIARLTGENARTLFAADRKEPNRATR